MHESIIVTFGCLDDTKPELEIDLYGESEESVLGQVKSHFGDTPWEITGTDPEPPDSHRTLDVPTLIEIQEAADGGHVSPAVVMAYWANVGDVEHAVEAYQGQYKSNAEFAEEQITSMEKIPEYLENYIDWDRFSADLLSADYFEVDGYYFRNL